MAKDKETATTLASLLNPPSLFGTKESYAKIAHDFHPYHQHKVNVFLHGITTTIGVWGMVQWALLISREAPIPLLAVYMYGGAIAVTTPIPTAILHTMLLYGMTLLPAAQFATTILWNDEYSVVISERMVCLLAVLVGYALQDLAHWLCAEPTYMSSYINAQPWMLVIHSIWLLPLVIDSFVFRNYCFLNCLPSRNRNVVTQVANQKAVDAIRKWITDNVPETPETTHVWPHQQTDTDQPVTALENDSGILAGFRNLFDATHYDVRPVVAMNELYITAVGAKQDMNSDAVFYTPHTDGPYWWLPFGASLYRVLVGVTPNQMVRTRFNMQHHSLDQVVDQYDVLGFDYNRELHWIDHVPGATNAERRSLVKLHYIVYPKGWHRYGQWCAQCNATYNTWARGNFLQTLRPSSVKDHVLAWWIWICTWTNALLVEHVGWWNLVYIAGSFALDRCLFGTDHEWSGRLAMVLTSFRHYLLYITTFAFREPQVALGNLMRDAKLYKTISMIHLARTILPHVQWESPTWSWPTAEEINPNWGPLALAISLLGFGTTLLATARLGMVRTYFGCELGYEKPCWIHGFPYGTLPHPMIMGQIFAFGIILAALWTELPVWELGLGLAHIGCYATHMTQEIVTGGY